MCQEKVYNILKEAKSPMTVLEINSRLNLSRSTITTSLAKMIRYKEVERITLKRRGKFDTYKYRIKRGK